MAMPTIVKLDNELRVAFTNFLTDKYTYNALYAELCEVLVTELHDELKLEILDYP
jgi:hypothetical protein